MKRIELTQGKCTLVDDEDYEWLMQWKWYTYHNKHRNLWYAVYNLNPRLMWMHRIIMDAPKGIQVDHKNHDTLNNQKYNLRLATNQQNIMGKRKQRKIASSQYKGVCWFKIRMKWLARIGFNGRFIHLGYFLNEEDAAEAYDRAAMEYFGEFAYLNFIYEDWPP